MTGGGNNGAPVNDRVTIGIGADGSAGVAFLCAGSFLVGNRCLGVVMPLADGVLQVSDGAVQLGTNVLTDVGEACNIVCGYVNRAIGILYFAEERLVAYGNDRAGRAAAVSSCPLIVCGNTVNALIPCPSIYRNGKEGLLSGKVRAFVGDGDGRLAGDLVDVIGVAEACCGRSVLESPLGSGVQPDSGCDLIDLLSLIGVDQKVVLIAHLQGGCAYCLAHKRYNGIARVGSDSYLSGHLCYIALLVGDLEGDVMNAVGQCKVTGVDLACGELAGNSLTVHINLRAGAVDAGRIAGVVDHILNCVGSEGKNVGLNSRTVKGVSVQVIKCERVRNDGSVTIVYYVGVVEGDVVDIEGYVLSAGSR